MAVEASFRKISEDPDAADDPRSSMVIDELPIFICEEDKVTDFEKLLETRVTVETPLGKTSEAAIMADVRKGPVAVGAPPPVTSIAIEGVSRELLPGTKLAALDWAFEAANMVDIAEDAVVTGEFTTMANEDSRVANLDEVLAWLKDTRVDFADGVTCEGEFGLFEEATAERDSMLISIKDSTIGCEICAMDVVGAALPVEISDEAIAK